MKMRLDRLLANNGVGSRSEVKDFIKKGLVRVNGSVETKANRQVSETDEILVSDEAVVHQQYVYFMLNKPEGVLSATRDRRETVLDLLSEKDRRDGIFPVGRLDRDTTGLLLLTDDGRLGHDLLSPKRKVPKTYEATLDGDCGPDDVQAFLDGFDLRPEGVHTMPARLEIVGPAVCRVTIQEGKYHQVKRMFSARGREVLALKRLSMGPLSLDPALKPGEYRPLTKAELDALCVATGRGNE